MLKIPPLAVPPDEIAASTTASDKDALVLLLQPLPAKNNAEPTIASNQEARPHVITQVSTTTLARATRNDSRTSGICDLAHTVDSRFKRDECADGHLVEVLGFADDAEDEVGQFGGRFEQQPALDGASCDFDQRACWDEAE